MDSLYPTELLKLAAAAELRPRLDGPCATAKGRSVLCGSRITLDARFEGGAITEIGFDIDACALGRASAEIMARLVPGKPASEVKALIAEVERLITAEAEVEPPAILAPIIAARRYKARHGSVLMAWRTLGKLIGDEVLQGEGSVPS